jgi:8-oxo-dGTP diphosphatase
MVEKRPRVSIALIIKKEGQVLLGKRKRFPVAWGFPGGKLDFGEDIEQSILREVSEEVGIRVKNIKFATITNDILKEIDEHFVTIIMTADYDSGEVILKEPEKCEEWRWADWNNLPKPLSSPVMKLKEQGFILF